MNNLKDKPINYSRCASKRSMLNGVLIGAIIITVTVVILIIGTTFKKVNYYIFYENEVKQTIQEVVKSSALK